MANLASSGVTLLRAWTEGGLALKDRSVLRVSMVLSTMGTATNTIPATAFGLSVIEEVSSLVQDDDTDIIVAGPSNDGSLILLKAAGTNSPADFSGTYEATIRGY